MPLFDERIFVAEAIDDPHCDAERLLRTYGHLAIINTTLSRMGHLLRRHVLEDVLRVGGSATVLEFGCGGGDMLASLARAGIRAGASLRLVGLDSDPRAVACAKQTLAPHANACVEQGSIHDLARFPADYVFCNHVLHHFSPSDVVPALRRLRLAAGRQLLVNDLERSAAAYWLYSALARAVFHKSFVYSDGRLSIRKGFRVHELEVACRQAGFPPDFRVARLPPWRVVITAPGG